MVRSCALAVLLSLVLPGLGLCQTGNRVAIGAALGVRATGRPDATGDFNPIFIWRIGHDGPGWGFRYGFNWFDTDLVRAIDGRPTPFGHLNVRPIMVGYGYRFALGRLATLSANLKGGYAFSSFSMQPGFGDRYQDSLGVRGVQADVHNTFVVKPELAAWVDLSRKVGLNITAGYMIARPNISLSTSAGADRRRIDADMFMMKIGAVYSIF